MNLNILHEREHSLVKSAFELFLKQHVTQGTQGFVSTGSLKYFY